MYKPLNMFSEQTDELKKIIAEHPDYPIVVLCNYEVCADDSYNWWYAPTMRFKVGELLDCEQDVNDERVYSDRGEFEDDLENMLSDSGDYDETTDEEFDNIVKSKLEEYEPYWRKVILIMADV